MKRGPVLIVILLAVFSIGIIGYKLYNQISSKSGTALQTLSRITPQERQCVISKIGRSAALELVNVFRQTQTISPHTLNEIKACLPQDISNYLELLTQNNNNANGIKNAGLVMGTGVMIQQLPQLCNKMQQDGSRFNWLTLSWQRIQPQKGQWAYNQFDTWVNSYLNCGQEVAVHILADASWAIQPYPPGITQATRHKPSMPAKNSQDYYNFVYNVASHYKGKITRYSIENEAHAQTNWGGTPQEYMIELQTAYKAIKAADPEAIVEDAAMSHEGLGYIVTNWLYQKGEKQQALSFANSYDVNFQRNNQSLKASNIAELQASLNRSGVQKIIQWENLLFANHAYYDHMQIHNGAPWQDLQIVLDYLHSSLQAQGDDKPIDLWEGWYSFAGAPGNGFDPNVQAREIVKQVVTAFANKIMVYNYWTFNDFAISEGHPGLVDNQGNPRPAAESYKLTSEKLTGSTSVQKLNFGPNIFGYEFTAGNKKVFVVWSRVDSTVTLPINGGLTITDIQGNVKTISSKVLPVTTSPVFVEPQ